MRMDHRASNIVAAEERHTARQRRIRGWARFLRFVLAGLCLGAIWQERALAPPVHDGMNKVADLAMTYIEDSETLSQALAELQKSYDKMTSDG